jgi:hypothetical protein
VDPWRIANKFFEEFRRRNHACKPATGIGHVGNAALDEIAVFIIHGHLPHLLARTFSSDQE